MSLSSPENILTPVAWDKRWKVLVFQTPNQCAHLEVPTGAFEPTFRIHLKDCRDPLPSLPGGVGGMP